MIKKSLTIRLRENYQIDTYPITAATTVLVVNSSNESDIQDVPGSSDLASLKAEGNAGIYKTNAIWNHDSTKTDGPLKVLVIDSSGTLALDALRFKYASPMDLPKMGAVPESVMIKNATGNVLQEKNLARVGDVPTVTCKTAGTCQLTGAVLKDGSGTSKAMQTEATTEIVVQAAKTFKIDFTSKHSLFQRNSRQPRRQRRGCLLPSVWDKSASTEGAEWAGPLNVGRFVSASAPASKAV